MRAAWLVLALGCSSSATLVPAPDAAPDPRLLGAFEDDYGNHFTITPELWIQLPRARYHVIKWRADQQYLIAQNDAKNPGEALLFTRIDWVGLADLAPYQWAFCLTAYAAPNPATAESTTTARRDTPRTGCNGHPFSRMRPLWTPPHPSLLEIKDHGKERQHQTDDGIPVGQQSAGYSAGCGSTDLDG